jgi:hypothetical protein
VGFFKSSLIYKISTTFSFSADSSIQVDLPVYAEQPQRTKRGIEQGMQFAGHKIVHVATFFGFGSFEKG